MKLLKSRAAAAIVLAAVVLLMTPFGMKRSLQAASDKVERGFYEGVRAEGYTSPGVDKHIGDSENYLTGLLASLSSAKGLDDETAKLTSARRELLSAKTAKERLSAFNSCREALDEISPSVEAALSGRDKEDWARYSGLFTGAAAAVAAETARYNSSVEEFYSSVLSRFPASLIASALGVDAPEALEG